MDALLLQNYIREIQDAIVDGPAELTDDQVIELAALLGDFIALRDHAAASRRPIIPFPLRGFTL